MIKKENKIIVAVAPDAQQREQMIRRIAVELGFALTPSDAAKIIRQDIYSFDLSQAYFVLCNNYTFRSSVITTQRLFELAARGIAVVIGVRTIPRELEFFCKSFYPSDFNHL